MTNINIEAGFMVQDFCRETGRETFHPDTDTPPLLAWLAADGEPYGRRESWDELRHLHATDDAGLIERAAADPRSPVAGWW